MFLVPLGYLFIGLVCHSDLICSVMACACSICTGAPKPDGCKCPGDKHVSIYCFITKPQEPTIADMLRRLNLPVSNEGIGQGLAELLVRIALTKAVSPPVNPWG